MSSLKQKYSADKTSEQAVSKLPLLKTPVTQLYPPPSVESDASLRILLLDQNSVPKASPPDCKKVTHSKGMSSYITGGSTDEGLRWGWSAPLTP